MNTVELSKDQLIRHIEQQLDNIQCFDEDLAWEYHCELYYEYNDDEKPQPIVELFTPELLEKLTQIASDLDVGYDQKPVTMKFTVEEHELLNSILVHAIDGMNLAIPCIYDFPEDSEIRQRYEMLEQMKNRSYSLWSTRFGSSFK